MMRARLSTATNAALAALASLVLLAGCAASGPPARDTERSPGAAAHPAIDDLGARAAAIALEQVGVPYRYGGAGPAGFDCSGLVQYSYLKAGKPLPRTTGQLWQQADTITGRELQAGDLLFFSISGKMQHVGLYVGNGRFVHAPSSGRHVTVASLSSDYYREALLRAGRPR